jgi:uncharacterized repeat protein (TIGR01451 family)
VLAKKPEAEELLRKLFFANQGLLNDALRLKRTTRHSEINDSDTSVTVFTNEAAFTAAIPNTSLVGFGGILPAGTTFEGFNPLVASGVSFSTPTPGTTVNVNDADYYSPNDYQNAFLCGSSSRSSQQTLNITLQTPSSAVAIDYGQLFSGGMGAITLSNGFTYRPATLPTVGNTAFVGFVSNTPITGLSYTVSGADWVIEDIRIVPSPNLSMVITHSGDFEPVQNGAMYTVAVSNTGAAPTSGNVTVADSLPPMITATNMSGMGWTCVLSTLTCTRADALAPLASYSAITITVDVGLEVAGGVTNTALVSGGGAANANAHVLHPGDAGYHRAEDHECDDHRDQVNECVAQRLHGGRLGGADIAEDNGYRDAEQHLSREALINRRPRLQGYFRGYGCHEKEPSEDQFQAQLDGARTTRSEHRV